MRGDQAQGSLVLYQTSAQLVMLYYMVSKKHLPERIVPLRVPFAGVACPKVHVRAANAENHLGSCKNKKGSSLVHRPNIPLRTLAFGFTQSEVHIWLIRQ